MRTTCLSCHPASLALGFVNLYNSTCIATCPAGTYANNSVCLPCVTQCATCSNSTHCLTCNTASSSLYPYFYNSFCFNNCPQNFYVSTLFICTICDTNCQTCVTSAITCTSCVVSGVVPYLFNSKCVSTCGAGYAPISNVCIRCSSPCDSCTGTLT